MKQIPATTRYATPRAISPLPACVSPTPTKASSTSPPTAAASSSPPTATTAPSAGYLGENGGKEGGKERRKGVRREKGVRPLLACNLVRWAMATAATLANVLPRVLSFTGAKRLLAMFADHLRLAVGKRISRMRSVVLANIAALKLPCRPTRIEPRAKKRRPKPLPLLSVPRQVAREEIRVRRTLKLVA